EGNAWSGYGEYSFTNFADPVVRAYNIALAEEAAELGFDDILYDYIRRPDGDASQMVFPGLTTTPEESIASFLAESRVALHKHGAFRSEEHTSELQSRENLVCRLLLEKKNS